MSFPLQLKAYSKPIDARLAELLPPLGKPPRELHEAMRYSCLLPGKRIRPILCMACAESIGGEPLSVLDAACAIEMVHCFSLVHDDLPAIDNDELRRGAPSLHKKYGEAIAILAGDALFALAFQTLSGSNHTADRVVAAMKSLTAASGSDGLVGGEVVDVLSEGKEVDEPTLHLIHTHKTGALIAASCEIGAILAGGSPEQIQGLRMYGEHLGLAFQIVDDVLNETSTQEQLGKSAGSDRERRKATYPALYGVEQSRIKASDEATAAISALNRSGLTSRTLADLARFAVERIH